MVVTTNPLAGIVPKQEVTDFGGQVRMGVYGMKVAQPQTSQDSWPRLEVFRHGCFAFQGVGGPIVGEGDCELATSGCQDMSAAPCVAPALRLAGRSPKHRMHGVRCPRSEDLTGVPSLVLWVPS